MTRGQELDPVTAPHYVFVPIANPFPHCSLSAVPITVHVVPPYYRRLMWTGTQSWGCGLWNVAWLHLPLTPWLGSIIIRYNGPSPLSALVNYRLTV